MNYEQLIEELREEMLQLVNTKCDALLQMYRSGEMHTDKRDTIRESSLITVSPAELKGKRPLADRKSTRLNSSHPSSSRMPSSA